VTIALGARRPYSGGTGNYGWGCPTDVRAVCAGGPTATNTTTTTTTNTGSSYNATDERPPPPPPP